MDWIFDSIGTWLKGSILGSLFENLEPAMLTFLLLGVVGAVLLLLSFLLDGIFDAFDFGGDGPLSLTTISAFVSVFGFSALAASSFGMGANGSAIVGTIVGFIGATGSFWMTRSMKNMESNGHEESSLAGLYGVVTIPIPEGGLGEVAITKSGERLHMAARARAPIPTGEKVLVESVISSGSVFVALPAAVVPEDEQPQKSARSSMESSGDHD